MKSLGKILGLVFLGLLLILVAAGFALTHLFDPNDYKDEIRDLARSKAGVELDIKGDIGWSLFPWLGLELHETTLASAQTPAQPFADLRMLGLSVRVMPLLSREVQMSDIKVNGLNLTLSRDEQGRGNWEGVGQPTGRSEQAGETPKAAEPQTEQREEASPARKPLTLDIDSLTVSDARVTYHDAKTGQQYSAESIELTTGAIREGGEAQRVLRQQPAGDARAYRAARCTALRQPAQALPVRRHAPVRRGFRRTAARADADLQRPGPAAGRSRRADRRMEQPQVHRQPAARAG